MSKKHNLESLDGNRVDSFNLNTTPENIFTTTHYLKELRSGKNLNNGVSSTRTKPLSRKK